MRDGVDGHQTPWAGTNGAFFLYDKNDARRYWSPLSAPDRDQDVVKMGRVWSKEYHVKINSILLHVKRCLVRFNCFNILFLRFSSSNACLKKMAFSRHIAHQNMSGPERREDDDGPEREQINNYSNSQPAQSLPVPAASTIEDLVRLVQQQQRAIETLTQQYAQQAAQFSAETQRLTQQNAQQAVQFSAETQMLTQQNAQRAAETQMLRRDLSAIQQQHPSPLSHATDEHWEWFQKSNTASGRKTSPPGGSQSTISPLALADREGAAAAETHSVAGSRQAELLRQAETQTEEDEEDEEEDEKSETFDSSGHNDHRNHDHDDDDPSPGGGASLSNNIGSGNSRNNSGQGAASPKDSQQNQQNHSGGNSQRGQHRNDLQVVTSLLEFLPIFEVHIRRNYSAWERRERRKIVDDPCIVQRSVDNFPARTSFPR